MGIDAEISGSYRQAPGFAVIQGTLCIAVVMAKVIFQSIFEPIECNPKSAVPTSRHARALGL